MNQEIIEGNKLIAEFMGMKPMYSGKEITGWEDETGNGAILGEYKPYEDWNELMPVVEKIFSLGKMVSVNYYPDAKAVNCKIYNWELGAPEQEKEGSDPLNTIWECVIQFIKWYNSQQQKPQS